MGYFRFYLAFLVCYAHLAHDNWISLVRYFGPIPVEVFFLISGFLMPLAYETYYLKKKFFFKNYFYFISSRFIKIFPLYWIAVLISYLDQSYIHYLNNDWGIQDYIIENLILIIIPYDKMYLPVAWSLDHEIRFYLLLPLIYYLTKKNKLFFLILGFFIFFISEEFVASTSSIKESLKFFYLGYFLFLYKKNLTNSYQRICERFKILQTYGIVGFSICFHICSIVASKLFSFTTLLTSISLMMIAIALIINENYEKNSRRNIFFGNLSYAVYILASLSVGYFFNGYKKLYLYFFQNSYSIFYDVYQGLMALITITIIAYFANYFLLRPIDKLRQKLKK